MIKEHDFAAGEQLNIVGHSHGGNIGILVSQMTERKIDTLVTLGTPASPDYRQNYGKIGQHIQAYSNFDLTQKLGGTQMSVSQVVGQALFGNIGGWVGRKLSWGQFGLAGRKFDGAENVGVTWRAGLNPFSAHTNLWKNSGVWSKIDNFLPR